MKSKALSIEHIKQIFSSLYPAGEGALEELLKVVENFRGKSGNVDWLYEGKTVGMMLYVDRFGGGLKDLEKKVGYFKDLGITLVHLMPLLCPREGENDGGYAVADYRAIDPKVGDLKSFKSLISSFHKNGIRLCIDYVVNHTSDDHEWAQKAKAGDPDFQSFYMMYETDEIPQKFEKTLNEVFPKVAPGNFTYVKEADRWVMTTFYPFQWDLNYMNPKVTIEMIKNLLFFAELGIDMVRLDAIPFVWKALGTSGRNLPEAHKIMKLFRAVIDYCAPQTALLGEAIMSPETIVKYFGSNERPECHVLYNASYMVEIWNAIATRDARHLAQMKVFDVPDQSIWINYARCHDDIGWGLNEEVVRSLGFDPKSHKQFLIDFYLGALKDSFSKGELYEYDVKTGDARNSGTLASLAGLEKALDKKSKYLLELALKRIDLINALYILRKGIPMLYSGDEIGQMNDYTYKNDENHAHDSRWLHRPMMDWTRVEEITNRGSVEESIYSGLKKLILNRRDIEDEQIIFTSNAHVLIVQQKLLDTQGARILMFNLSEDRQWVFSVDLKRYGLEGSWQDVLQGMRINFQEEVIMLGPYEFFVIEK